MVKIIMHGCNGHMGQVISGLVEKDSQAQIVAGIDIADSGKNSYPVYTNIEAVSYTHLDVYKRQTYVQFDIFRFSVLTDDHTGVNLFAGAYEQGLSLIHI